MALLSKAQLLKPVLPTQDVPVPELGGEVRIVLLSAARRIHFYETLRAGYEAQREYHLDQERPEKQRKGLPEPVMPDEGELLISLCVVDENGEHPYEGSDSTAIRELPAFAVNRIHAAIVKFNNLDGIVADMANVEAEKKD